MDDPVTDPVLMGFAHGKDHPLFRAVMAELDAFRDAAVEDAKAAVTERETCKALGAVEILDDVKAKFEANVRAVTRKLEQEAAEKGG